MMYIELDSRILVTQLPVNDPRSGMAEYRALLPYLESAREHPEQVYESVNAYYPKLKPEEVSLIYPTESVDLQPSIDAFEFWLDRLYPVFEAAKQKLNQAGINTAAYYWNGVTKFILDLSSNIPSAITYKSLDVQGNITGVRLKFSYPNPRGIIGEYIHLVQNRDSIVDGITPLGQEGVSTLLEYILLQEWINYNQQQIEAGRPENAIMMPIYDLNGGIHVDLSVSQFNEILKSYKNTELTSIVTVASSFFQRYVSVETLGQSREYSARMQLLGEVLDTEEHASDPYYQYNVEWPSLLLVLQSLGVITPEDALILSPLTQNGQAFPTSSFSPEVQKAYQNLLESNLISTPNEWQNLIAMYKTTNFADLALYPVFRLVKVDPFSTFTDTLVLNAYQIISSPDDNTFFYSGMDRDIPEVRVFMRVPDGEGEKWIHRQVSVKKVELEVKRSFAYEFDMPAAIWDGLIRHPIPEGTVVVVEAKLPKILGVSMPVALSAESYEVTVHREPSAAVAQAEDQATQPTDQDDPDRAPIGPDMSFDPITVAASELSPEQLAELTAIKQQMEQARARRQQPPDVTIPNLFPDSPPGSWLDLQTRIKGIQLK